MVENQEEGNEEIDVKRKNYKQGFRERRVRKYLSDCCIFFVKKKVEVLFLVILLILNVEV